MQTLRIECISERPALDSLSLDWDTLLEQSRFQTIFRSWDWANTWLKLHLADRPLHVIAIWHGQTLVGLAPFYVTEMKLLGLLRYRCLRVIGDMESGAEYLTPFFHADFESAAQSALVGHLQEQTTNWDLLWLPNQASWNPADAGFRTALIDAKLGIAIRPADFAAIQLGDTQASFWEQQSGSNRTMVRRAQKRLAGHTLRFEQCRNAEELEVLQAELFHLHHLRWQSSGEQGAFVRRPGFKSFVTAILPVMLENGWLRMHALRVNDKVQAIQFGFVYHGVYSILQEGFDPDSSKGIGHVLRAMVMEACIAEGLQEYDFLGGFTEHKRRWGARHRAGEDVLIWRHQLKSVPFALRPLWPTGRFLQEET